MAIKTNETNDRNKQFTQTDNHGSMPRKLVAHLMHSLLLLWPSALLWVCIASRAWLVTPPLLWRWLLLVVVSESLVRSSERLKRVAGSAGVVMRLNTTSQRALPGSGLSTLALLWLPDDCMLSLRNLSKAGGYSTRRE